VSTPSTEPSIPEDAEASPSHASHALSRRAFAGGAGLAVGAALVGALHPSAVSAAVADPATAGAGGDRGAPSDFGSVSAAPRLPSGFARTFKSRFIRANGIRQHVVIGGAGPPLLLVHGWPENWYAWRLLMPTLARSFTVIAVDQRGIGLTEKPRDGYDTGTLARDLVGLMDALGHQRFAVVGHDTGYTISYALAADHRERVDRLALAEIPGPPGLGAGPHLFEPEEFNNKLWHIPFNRVNDEMIVDMVRSHANAYYRYEFAIQGGGVALPEHAIEYYIRLFTRDRDVLRASFGLYRAWDAIIAQNMARSVVPLTIPVLGIGGAESWGAMAAGGMAGAATDIQTAVIAGAGHWVAEQAPDEMLGVLTTFLEPYRAS
jgi:pimeloyl-ACP methyl ester carboxylesterase